MTGRARCDIASGVPRDVLCFGTDWYSPSKVSIRQIVEGLHERGSRVLWINPVPIRFPKSGRKQLWRKVQSKARTHSRILRRQDENVYVYSPVYLPVFRGPCILVNRLVISFQIVLLRLLLRMRLPLVFGSTFTTWFGLPAVRGLPMVFHFADKISAFREVAADAARRRIIEKMEKDIVSVATLATCSSRRIHDHVRALAIDDPQKAVYLPHAVKASAFFCTDGLPVDPEEPVDIRSLPRPRAGYFGSLTEANDKDAFIYAARSLPAWSFVFIGRVAGDYEELSTLRNVYFLGPKKHSQIPAYCNAFDVGFMGWRSHEWITNCFPLKTLEYLALGKPVVCSSHIDELAERFSGLVSIAESPEGFRACLVREYEEDSVDRRHARWSAVKNETWDRRIDEILVHLAARGARYVC